MKEFIFSQADTFLIALFLSVLLFACSKKGMRQTQVQDSTVSENEIKVLERIEIDSVPGDFPVQFRFLADNDWQFVAYYNKNRNLTVASRKIKDNKWMYKVLPTKVGWDSHNRIEIAIDRDRCIHVTGNMHNDSMTYFITQKPYDISSFKKTFPLVAAADELRSTYPKYIKTPQGQIIFSYRKGGSGNGITITNIYDEQSKSFKRLTDKPLFDGLGQMSAYPRGPSLGPDGWYHLTWLWRDTPDCETNHDLSYARSKDLITWETVDGKKQELPITPEHAHFIVDPVPPGGGVLNGTHRLTFDQDNTPLMVYMKFDSEGNNQYFLAKAQNGKWNNDQISNWNYRWAFTGPGSIDFEIKMKAVKLLEKNTIEARYWHKKKGDGVLIIDSKNLSLIKDKSVNVIQQSLYPKALLKPKRTEDGMMVHWLNANSSNSKVTTALRWETMGKRRYYKPPKKPVKPAVLELYTFSLTK